MDLPDDVCGEESVEFLSEAFGILSKHGEGVAERPFGDQASVGNQVVQGPRCDSRSGFSGFLDGESVVCENVRLKNIL